MATSNVTIIAGSSETLESSSQARNLQVTSGSTVVSATKNSNGYNVILTGLKSGNAVVQWTDTSLQIRNVTVTTAGAVIGVSKTASPAGVRVVSD